MGSWSILRREGVPVQWSLCVDGWECVVTRTPGGLYTVHALELDTGRSVWPCGAGAWSLDAALRACEGVAETGRRAA